jgi:hypothetical protein
MMFRIQRVTPRPAGGLAGIVFGSYPILMRSHDLRSNLGLWSNGSWNSFDEAACCRWGLNTRGLARSGASVSIIARADPEPPPPRYLASDAETDRESSQKA